MKEKLSLLSELIKLARADKENREAEYGFLLAISELIGVEKAEFNALFDEYIEFTPPPLEFDRILQFQRLILLANIDMEVHALEYDMLMEAGLKLGLNPTAIENVLEEMNKYENGMIPPDVLLEIFKVHYN